MPGTVLAAWMSSVDKKALVKLPLGARMVAAGGTDNEQQTEIFRRQKAHQRHEQREFHLKNC